MLNRVEERNSTMCKGILLFFFSHKEFYYFSLWIYKDFYEPLKLWNFIYSYFLFVFNLFVSILVLNLWAHLYLVDSLL